MKIIVGIVAIYAVVVAYVVEKYILQGTWTLGGWNATSLVLATGAAVYFSRSSEDGWQRYFSAFVWPISAPLVAGYWLYDTCVRTGDLDRLESTARYQWRQNILDISLDIRAARVLLRKALLSFTK